VKRASLMIAMLLAGCGGGTKSTSTAATTPAAAPAVKLSGSLRVASTAFKPNGPIPRQYTCDGQDIPIPLQFAGVPTSTHELLLVMRDPDAPTGNFVHWAVAGIAPAATSVPANSIEGRNSFGSLGYRGPCPPPGDKPHHYVVTLSALAGASGLTSGFTPDQPVRSGQLAIATLIGTYSRR
jgi:Raf kinase inhibitor-like YbhB/YbcL family protein